MSKTSANGALERVDAESSTRFVESTSGASVSTNWRSRYRDTTPLWIGESTGTQHYQCYDHILQKRGCDACNGMTCTKKEGDSQHEQRYTMTLYVTEQTTRQYKNTEVGSTKQTYIIRKSRTTTEPILIDKDMFILTNAKQCPTLDREKDYSAEAVQVVKEGKSPCFQIYIGKGRCDVALYGAPPALVDEVKSLSSRKTETNKLVRDLLAHTPWQEKKLPTTIKTWSLDTLLTILTTIQRGSTTPKEMEIAQRKFLKDGKRGKFVGVLARYPAAKRAEQVKSLKGSRKLLEEARDLKVQALVPDYLLRYLRRIKKQFTDVTRVAEEAENVCTAIASVYKDEAVTCAQIMAVTKSRLKSKTPFGFGLVKGDSGVAVHNRTLARCEILASCARVLGKKDIGKNIEFLDDAKTTLRWFRKGDGTLTKDSIKYDIDISDARDFRTCVAQLLKKIPTDYTDFKTSYEAHKHFFSTRKPIPGLKPKTKDLGTLHKEALDAKSYDCLLPLWSLRRVLNNGRIKTFEQFIAFLLTPAARIWWLTLTIGDAVAHKLAKNKGGRDGQTPELVGDFADPVVTLLIGIANTIADRHGETVLASYMQLLLVPLLSYWFAWRW